MSEVTKKKYYFMQFAEWFYVDKDFNLKLTRMGQSIPKCVNSYNRYLKDLEAE